MLIKGAPAEYGHTTHMDYRELSIPNQNETQQKPVYIYLTYCRVCG